MKYITADVLIFMVRKRSKNNPGNPDLVCELHKLIIQIVQDISEMKTTQRNLCKCVSSLKSKFWWLITSIFGALILFIIDLITKTT